MPAGSLGKLSIKIHPDKNGNSSESKQAFQVSERGNPLSSV